MINQQNMKVKNGTTWNTVCPFPVGYIYMSSNSTSPATTFGGTWAALSDSKFLRPSGSWNTTGGADTVVLTELQMPAHSHRQYVTASVASGSGLRLDYNVDAGSGQGGRYDQGIYTGEVGGGQAHNNVPAYRTCYCWYRTA